MRRPWGRLATIVLALGVIGAGMLIQPASAHPNVGYVKLKCVVIGYVAVTPSANPTKGVASFAAYPVGGGTIPRGFTCVGLMHQTTGLPGPQVLTGTNITGGFAFSNDNVDAVLNKGAGQKSGPCQLSPGQPVSTVTDILCNVAGGPFRGQSHPAFSATMVNPSGLGTNTLNCTGDVSGWRQALVVAMGFTLDCAASGGTVKDFNAHGGGLVTFVPDLTPFSSCVAPSICAYIVGFVEVTTTCPKYQLEDPSKSMCKNV